MVNTPVLFETFVRVDYARQVWEAIKDAQPKKLYFYSNKGRAEKEGEIERNNEIRSWVKEIDWDCELYTWFREECVDVYTSLKGAVDWVCEHEEAWITLEDDVVPTPAFFSFCDQMIDYYRYNDRVWYVSGDNFWNLNPSGYDYIFSSYHWMYGWATWRDRWLAIDWDNLRIDEMIKQGVPYHFYKTKSQARARIRQLKKIKEFVERTKCWDYIFGIVCDQHNSVGVFPKQHLINNIGETGEHHKKNGKTFVNVQCNYMGAHYIIDNRPSFVLPDYEFDYQSRRSIYNQKPFKAKLKLFFKGLIKRAFK